MKHIGSRPCQVAYNPKLEAEVAGWEQNFRGQWSGFIGALSKL